MTHSTPGLRQHCAFVLATALLLLCACDHWPWDTFTRNPKLRLFRSEVERFDAHTLFEAAWAPDGSAVYYLRTATILREGGSLWRTDSTGNGAVLILDGIFALLAVSPDGRTIGLATGDFSGEYLVLLDVEHLSAETVPPIESGVCDLSFSRTNPRELYYTTGGRKLFRYGMDDREHHLVDSLVMVQFVLMDSDSAVFFPDGYDPDLDPSGRYVVYSVGWNQGVFLIDMEAGDTVELDANPYERSWIESPRWAPDGQRLLLTAGDHVGDPPDLRGGQLWILQGVTQPRRSP